MKSAFSNGSRRLAGALLTGLLLAGGALARQAPAPPLTLSQAVAEALRSSPRLEAAQAEQNKARAQAAQARAGYLPRVDFDEGFTRGNNPVYVFGTLLTQQRFSQADFSLPALNQPAPLNNFRTRFTASMNIFDGRQTQLRVREAKLGEQLAGNARQQARQGVMSAAISAYYNLSASLAEETVAASAEKTAAESLRMAEASYRAGMVVESDRLSAQVYHARTQEELIAARNQVKVAEAALNRELGRPLNAPIAIETGAIGAAAGPATSLATLLTDAQRMRPELRMQQDRLSIAGSEVTRAKSAFLPTLDGFASWERDQLHFTNTGGSNWTVGVTLHFNLFKGGADRATLEAAAAQRAAAGAQLRDLKTAVGLQVRQAWYAVETARQQLQVSQGATAQAEAALKIVRNRYHSGLATMTDLLRAETELTSARSQFVQASYNLQMSRANRDLAVGTLSPLSAVVTGSAATSRLNEPPAGVVAKRPGQEMGGATGVRR